MKSIRAYFRTGIRNQAIPDALSLGAVLNYCLYRFLQSTMFSFHYSQMYKLLTMGLLLVLGGGRYLYIMAGKWKNTEDRKKFLLRCLGAWLLALPFFYVGWIHDYKVLIFLPVCCMCLYDMDSGKVFRAFAFTIGILLTATILCSLSGTVRNLVNTERGRTAAAYGIINTTDFASCFTFLFLAAWCGIRDEDWRKSLCLTVASMLTTALVYIYSGSRTSLYCGALFVLFAVWNIIRRKKNTGAVGKGIDWISVLAFPLTGIAVIALTACYHQGLPWAVQLDGALSGRLRDTWTPFQTYGIKPFGNLITNGHGRGGTLLSDYWSSGYGYLDIAYAMSAIKYGWVITAIIAGFLIWTGVKAIKCGNRKIAFALAIMAVHAFSEARVLDINYNILLVMPLCAFAEKEEKPGRDQRIWPSLVPGIGILAGVYFILPRMLSWLRTLFAEKKWNSGTGAYSSLLVCTGIVILLLLLWISASRFLRKPGRRAAAALLCVSALLLGCGAAMNGEMERAAAEHRDRLAGEEGIIRTITEQAIEPVYAAEASELYARGFGGLSGHIFSTEELSRSRGTIIVNADVEALGIINSGGLYTRISDQSGVYSYDPAVIEALGREGYEWMAFCSGEHICSLKDTALFNSLNAGDGLTLNGPVRIVTKNVETDQLGGVYEVSFSLSGLSGTRKGEPAAVLGVVGDSDETTILQETLYPSDFDENNRCSRVLDYAIGPTPRVSYAVSVMDGVQVKVDGISWRMKARLEKTGGVQFCPDGILMTTYVPDNRFSFVHFQLYDAESHEFLLEFGKGMEAGRISGEYVHKLWDGRFYLRLKGNTNLADEWIQREIQLKNGSVIQYGYEIEEMDSGHIRISDIRMQID